MEGPRGGLFVIAEGGGRHAGRVMLVLHANKIVDPVYLETELA